MNVLYLDYDGVLHHCDVGRFRTPPTIRVLAEGHQLFEHASILTAALEPFPQVKIVLSTSWVRALGYSVARDSLPEPLRRRVIGATFHTRYHRGTEFEELPRYRQIIQDVARRRPERWLAIDDDADGWPSTAYDNIVWTHPYNGLANSQGELAEKLARWQAKTP
jgi:hypothetical protein